MRHMISAVAPPCGIPPQLIQGATRTVAVVGSGGTVSIERCSLTGAPEV